MRRDGLQSNQKIGDGGSLRVSHIIPEYISLSVDAYTEIIPWWKRIWYVLRNPKNFIEIDITYKDESKETIKFSYREMGKTKPIKPIKYGDLEEVRVYSVEKIGMKVVYSFGDASRDIKAYV